MIGKHWPLHVWRDDWSSMRFVSRHCDTQRLQLALQKDEDQAIFIEMSVWRKLVHRNLIDKQTTYLKITKRTNTVYRSHN